MTQDSRPASAVWTGMNLTVALLMALASLASGSRVERATRHLEAGEIRAAEADLEQAQAITPLLRDDVAQAELLNGWSALHLKLGRLADAEAELKRARDMVADKPGAVEIRPVVLHNLAAIEMRTGRYQDALRDEQLALGEWEAAPAPDHAAIVRGRASLASVQYMAGDASAARVSLDRALALATRVYGPEHPLLADLLDSDAVVLDTLHLKKDARRARERAGKIRGTAADPADDRVAFNINEAPAEQGQVYLRSK